MFYKKSFIILALFFWLTSITFGDNVPPSPNPPGGLSSSNVPQFVNWGFDDGYGTEGIKYILNYFKDKKNPVGQNNNPLTFDGTPARISFYMNSCNLDVNLFKELVSDGHELGNHTANHNNGGSEDNLGPDYPPQNYSVQGWLTEMNTCTDVFVNQVGVKESEVVGFRVPFLAYNKNCFSAIAQNNLIYDCTLHGGSNSGNGSYFNWPYTLNSSSPGQESSVGNHSGVWEVPTHYIIQTNGQIVTGLDFNMIEKASWGGMEMNKNQFLGALTHTFDLRYNGNRAPMTFGAHCHYYGYQDDDDCPNITMEARQEVLTEFFDYVLGKPDVRVVPSKAIIEWMRNPVGLDQTSITNNVNKKIKTLSINIKNAREIEFIIPSAGIYTFRLYSMNGKLIRTLTQTYLTPGSYTLPIPTNEISAGSYFIKLEGIKDSRVLKFATM